MSSNDGEKAHNPPPSVHNMEDLQSELESVSSALMSAPAIPVTRVESNDDGDGPSTAADPSSFITLMPPLSRVIPPPNFPVEAGELTVSPSTVRISSDEQLGMAGLGEMTLRIGVSAPTNNHIAVERPQELPSKFMPAEAPAAAGPRQSPSVEDEEDEEEVEEEEEEEEEEQEEEEEAEEERSSAEESSLGGRQKYVCKDCDKSFIYKKSWINHKLCHAGVSAPFECTACGKTFTFPNSVERHTKICKGRSRRRSAVEPKKKKGQEESSEDTLAEEGGEDEANTGVHVRKQNIMPASEERPELRVNSNKSTLKVTIAQAQAKTTETPDSVPIVKRGRGRPPKIQPPPSSVSTPIECVSATLRATSKPVTPSSSKGTPSKRVRVAEKRPSDCSQSAQDLLRSRSQRKIQPPHWMRNMEMDYEFPVHSGYYLDNSRPVSTGANWREVTSMTNEKRRKSAGDSASGSEDEFPSLQRQDATSESSSTGASSKLSVNEKKQVAANGNLSENDASGSSSMSGGNLNEHHSNESAETVSMEPKIPKKRGRKKKVVPEPPATEDSSQPAAVPVPVVANRASLRVAAYDSAFSPTKRSLRGLPHRSEVAAATSEEQSSPVPKKKLKIEEVDEPEDLMEDVTLPLEEEEEEQEQEQQHQQQQEQVEEDAFEELMDGMEEDDLDDEEDGRIIIMSQEREPINQHETFDDEEEEEDTDVVEGSDNEESPPPPQETAANVAGASFVGATASAAAPTLDFDLKSAAINFLGKKISNRNMHRIRRELMDLTDRGDYFQLTQWAPLAAGFLQAMLLRNFKELPSDIP